MDLRYGDLIREVSSQAWPRSAAPHCSLPREGSSQGSALRAFALAPKVGGILLPPPMRGLLAAPVRLRRPYSPEIISRAHKFFLLNSFWEPILQ